MRLRSEFLIIGMPWTACKPFQAAVLSSYAVDTAKAQKSAETRNGISTTSFALLRPFCGFAVWSR